MCVIYIVVVDWWMMELMCEVELGWLFMCIVVWVDEMWLIDNVVL